VALRAVIDHPKFTRLKVLLRLNRACTLGYLEALWHFTGRFTPQGNIGKYSDAEIEAWVEWDGEEGALISALVKAHWLDPHETHRLLVHDWHKHADDATRQALKRAKLEFAVNEDPAEVGEPVTVPTPEAHGATVSGQNSNSANGVATVSGHCGDVVAAPSGLPEPEPVPDPVPGAEPESARSENSTPGASRGSPGVPLLSHAEEFEFTIWPNWKDLNSGSVHAARLAYSRCRSAGAAMAVISAAIDRYRAFIEAGGDGGMAQKLGNWLDRRGWEEDWELPARPAARTREEAFTL